MRAWCCSCEYNVTPVCARSFLSSTCCGSSWWDVSPSLTLCNVNTGHTGHEYGPKRNSGKRVLRDCLSCLVSSAPAAETVTSNIRCTHTYLTNRRPVRCGERKRQDRLRKESGMKRTVRPSRSSYDYYHHLHCSLFFPVAHTLYGAVPRQCFKLLSFIYSEWR